MQVIATEIPEVLILQPKVFGDHRGFFFESFNAREFAQATGIHAQFVQDNHSRSTRGVLRGLHYQIREPQGKLVRVIGGEVFDVAVDIRKNSPTFKRWTGARLSDENKRMLWIPPGFAHGFLVLSEKADFLYKTTSYYSQSNDRVIRFDDPAIGVKWPLEELQGSPPIFSDKDLQAGLLEAAEVFD